MGLTFYPEYPSSMRHAAVCSAAVAAAMLLVGIAAWRLSVHPLPSASQMKAEMRQHLSR
jgi:hypothetical protein